MTRGASLLITVFAFALAVLGSSGAQADPSSDVDVAPDQYAPSVTVGVTEKSTPRKVNAAPSSAPARVRATFDCEQAPGAQATDLSCAVTEFPGTFSPLPMDVEGGASPGDIERAIREVPMPPHRLQVQPDGRTLVNVDTIFFTEDTGLRRTVVLLGQSVRLDARPVRYTWVHGDGTQHTTAKPGRPYPAKDVTHQYQQPGNDLAARVDTTYSVRYSVNGGAWTSLGATLTATGPTTTLDVDEAKPVLTE